MPTYDYVCAACGHVVEVIHGVHDHGPTVCPNCHAHAMRKAIAAPTILYKGTGWAKKDRGSSSITKAAAKAGSDGSASSDAGSGSAGGAAGNGGSAEGSSDRSPASGSASSTGSSVTPGSTSGSNAKGGSSPASATERD